MSEPEAPTTWNTLDVHGTQVLFHYVPASDTTYIIISPEPHVAGLMYVAGDFTSPSAGYLDALKELMVYPSITAAQQAVGVAA